MGIKCFSGKISVIRGDKNQDYRTNPLTLEATTTYPIGSAPRRLDSLTTQVINAILHNTDKDIEQLQKEARNTTVSLISCDDPDQYTLIKLPSDFSWQDEDNNMYPVIMYRRDTDSEYIIADKVKDNTRSNIVEPESITGVSIEKINKVPQLPITFETVSDNVHIEVFDPILTINEPGNLVISIYAESYGLMRESVYHVPYIEISGVKCDTITTPDKQSNVDKIFVAIPDDVPVSIIPGFSYITEIRVYNVPKDSRVTLHRYFWTYIDRDDPGANILRPILDRSHRTLTGPGELLTAYFQVGSENDYITDIEIKDNFARSPCEGTIFMVTHKHPNSVIDERVEFDVRHAWRLTKANGNRIDATSYAILSDFNLVVLLEKNTLYFYNARIPRQNMNYTGNTEATLVDLDIDYSNAEEVSKPMGVVGWKSSMIGNNLVASRAIKYRLLVTKPDGRSVYLVRQGSDDLEMESYGSDGWCWWHGEAIEYTVDQEGAHNILYEVVLADGRISRQARVIQANSVRAFMKFDLLDLPNIEGLPIALASDELNQLYLKCDNEDVYRINFYRSVFTVDYDNKLIYLMDKATDVMVGGLDNG